MVTLNFGLEDFKVKAENYNGADEKSQYGHYVNIFTNIGGYLSMAIFEDLRIGNLIEFDRTTFNYDFNQNKEILLSDIFEDGVDISNVIKSYIKENMKFPLTEEILEIGVVEAVNANNFYFDEYGVVVYFSPEGLKWDDYQKWVYVPFELFGVENIKLFN